MNRLHCFKKKWMKLKVYKNIIERKTKCRLHMMLKASKNY